jgi:hypothetical protein
MLPFSKPNQRQIPQPQAGQIVRTQGGQIVVEYVLLLTIGVAIAIVITNQLVKKDPADKGAIIAKWEQIRGFIGSDDPGKR